MLAEPIIQQRTDIQPSFDELPSLSTQGNLVPIYRELPADLETPVSVYLKRAGYGPSFLLESVDLHFIVVDELDPKLRKDFFISEINLGEPFGISALIEPYRYTGTVRTTCVSRVLKFNANGLRALCTVDPKIDAALMRQLASAAMSRLNDTRVQLAAARV